MLYAVQTCPQRKITSSRCIRSEKPCLNSSRKIFRQLLYLPLFLQSLFLILFIWYAEKNRAKIYANAAAVTAVVRAVQDNAENIPDIDECFILSSRSGFTIRFELIPHSWELKSATKEKYAVPRTDRGIGYKNLD